MKERVGAEIFLSNERIVRIHPHVQNTLSLRYTSGKKPQRKTIKTMYAFCYTERHSVWYVVYYCEHILTDICYRLERKDQLCLQMAILSCTFLTLHMMQEVYATVMRKRLFRDHRRSGGLTKAYRWLLNEIQAPLPRIRRRLIQTQEVNSENLKTWQTIASSEWFHQTKKNKTQKPAVSVWTSELFHKPEKQP